MFTRIFQIWLTLSVVLLCAYAVWNWILDCREDRYEEQREAAREIAFAKIQDRFDNGFYTSIHEAHADLEMETFMLTKH